MHILSRFFKIIYFSPAYRMADDSIIRSLLDKLEQETFIDQIIIEESLGRDKQDELYEKYFGQPKTSQLIRQRVGTGPIKLFTRQGVSNIKYIRGVIAISENDQIQWASPPPKCITLLQNIEQHGISFLNDLYDYSDKLKNEEIDLLDCFEDSKYCDGRLERNYRIPIISKGNLINTTSKYIDAVFFTVDNVHIIIEAEMTLNYTAIGQALCYEKWYQLINQVSNTQPAIVFSQYQPEFILAARSLNLVLFSVVDQEVRKID